MAAHPRAYFQRWFYNASPDMMRSLALMWIQDERFTHNIDRARPGLAAYQSSAVTAWAGSQVGKSE
ncbi:TipAS antibiotic-recognition domain-containing protein [Deinococcus malanensis]|uniref:TipAS antibiotic-recognition domain-containing protein n=1 Tax=Deinococcus malanensis TaxID=1706855 RepID=UPI003632B11A